MHQFDHARVFRCGVFAQFAHVAQDDGFGLSGDRGGEIFQRGLHARRICIVCVEDQGVVRRHLLLRAVVVRRVTGDRCGGPFRGDGEVGGHRQCGGDVVQVVVADQLAVDRESFPTDADHFTVVIACQAGSVVRDGV